MNSDLQTSNYSTEYNPELKHVKKLVKEIHKHSLLKRALGQYYSEEPLFDLFSNIVD